MGKCFYLIEWTEKKTMLWKILEIYNKYSLWMIKKDPMKARGRYTNIFGSFKENKISYSIFKHFTQLNESIYLEPLVSLHSIFKFFVVFVRNKFTVRTQRPKDLFCSESRCLNRVCELLILIGSLKRVLIFWYEERGTYNFVANIKFWVILLLLYISVFGFTLMTSSGHSATLSSWDEYRKQFMSLITEFGVRLV